MKIDYNKVFNVKVRNADCLLHDICKLILVSLLKKKNPNTPIYTEHNPENPNDSFESERENPLIYWWDESEQKSKDLNTTLSYIYYGRNKM